MGFIIICILQPYVLIGYFLPYQEDSFKCAFLHNHQLKNILHNLQFRSFKYQLLLMNLLLKEPVAI
jgi:hypothetical protein